MPGRKKNAFDPSAPRREQTIPQGRFADVWPPATDADRQALLKNIARAPVGYGTWRDLKALYKTVEQAALADPSAADTAVLGALMGRIDAARRTPESRQTPKASLSGASLNGFTALTALTDGRVLILGYSYQGGTKRRLVLLANDPADPLKPEVAGTLDLDYSYGSPTLRSVPGYLFLANSSYRGTTLEVIQVAAATDETGGAGGGSPLTLRGSDEVPAASELLGFDCVLLPGDGGVRGALLVKTGSRRQEKALLQILDLTPRGGVSSGSDGIRTLGQVELSSANAVALSPDGRFAIVGTSGSGFSWSSLPKPGGLRVYDLSDPAKPRQVGAMPLDNIVTIRAGGPADAPLAYVGVSRKNDRQPNGVHVVSLGTPAWPREVGFVALDSAPGQIYSHPQRPEVLFVSAYWGGAILDVSNPAAPRVLRQGMEPQLNISAASGDLLWTAENYGGLSPWYFADPSHPVRLGTPVSSATLGYMKRRIRRSLEEMAEKAPARYAATVTQMLVSAGRTAANVSPADQWATMEVLFGGGGRFMQKNHGRGAYVLVKDDAPRLSLRRREERHPEIWDAYPEAASTLAATKETPFEAREMALKALRAGHHPLPSLSISTLERMLISGMPLQTTLAVRQVVDSVSGRRKVSAAAAADAYRLAGSARRRRLEAGLETSLADPVWSGNFVRHTLKGMDERIETAAETPVPSRDAALLGLLFRATPRLFSMDAHRPLLTAVLRRDDPTLTGLVLKNLEYFTDPSNVYPVLEAVRGLPDPQRNAVVDAIIHGLTARAFNGFTANNLDVFSRVDPWLCRASWRILAADTATPEVLADLWRRILAATEPTDAVRAALSSPDALTALARSGIPTDEVAAALTERPFLVALLSPETFADVLRRTPPAVALQIIAAAPDEQWTRLRPALVRALAEGFGGAPFWAAIPKAMENDPEERLAARLLAEDEIAGTFLEIAEVESVLEIREPAFGPLLARWAERYITALPRDSVTLLTAATHELPEVRSAGLARVRSVGMGLPFALGLLESEVPPSVEVGRAFFEADQTEDGDRAYLYALALLDSPRASVREWGRGYAAGRLHRVSHAALCRALFENPNPDVQAFAADLVAGGLSSGESPTEAAAMGEPLNPAQTAQFDAEVLRQRNRSRRAKEKIKARQSAAPVPTVDVETLLSLARGADGTARDAEWALAQLTRLAIAGQPVEGLTLETVPGAEGAPAAPAGG